MSITRRHALALGAASLLLPGVAARAQDMVVVAEERDVRLSVEPPRNGRILTLDPDAPGTPLRLPQGVATNIRFENRLAEPLRFVWQGVRGLVPEPIIPAGGAETVTVTPPDAGTYLLRALDAGQQARGLARAIIVEEAAPPAVDRDLTYILQQTAFDPGYRSIPLIDVGDPRSVFLTTTLNGRLAPITESVRPAERLRIRLVNGTLSGVLLVGWSSPEATLIALDGQPTEPVRNQGNVLGPGQRLDWIVDAPARAGERIALVVSNDRPRPILTLSAEGEPAPARPSQPVAALPRSAADIRLDLRRASRHRLVVESAPDRIALSNPDLTCTGACPLFRVRRGTPVVLTVSATQGVAAIHMQGHALRPLDRMDDGWKPWLQDTLIAGSETALYGFVPTIPGRFRLEAVALDPRSRRAEAFFEVT